MKKTGNLNINPERVLNNEELISLKGGKKVFACQCSGSSNWWYCSPDSTPELVEIITDVCADAGGNCT